MLALYIVFVASLAYANGAPQYLDWRFSPKLSSPHFEDDFSPLKTDMTALQASLGSLTAMINELERKLLTDTANKNFENDMGKVVGDNYVITLSLPGFDEKDIVVKAKRGTLVVQATQEENEQNILNNYFLYKVLPINVGENGTWTYQNGELKIVFPFSKTKDVTEQVDDPEITTIATEEPIERSREEIEDINEKDNVMDADVGLQKEDNEILTNEIPTRRDPKNEVEFGF